MSLHEVRGWVADCHRCGDDVTEDVASKSETLKGIEESDAFRRGALVICWRCLNRRRCRIFGHVTYTSAACGQDHCSRCHRLIKGDAA